MRTPLLSGYAGAEGEGGDVIKQLSLRAPREQLVAHETTSASASVNDFAIALAVDRGQLGDKHPGAAIGASAKRN